MVRHGLLRSLCWPHPPSAQLKAGTLLPTPKPLRPFSLTGQDGKPFTLDNLRGRWTFLAIGYTSCPDICPTTLASFRAVSQQITPKGGRPPVQFLFVSVDPGRDTPERLAQHVHYFDPAFLGATGSDKELHELTAELGLSYLRVEEKGSALGYLMDDSAAMAADFAAIKPLTTNDRRRISPWPTPPLAPTQKPPPSPSTRSPWTSRGNGSPRVGRI